MSKRRENKDSIIEYWTTPDGICRFNVTFKNEYFQGPEKFNMKGIQFNTAGLSSPDNPRMPLLKDHKHEDIIGVISRFRHEGDQIVIHGAILDPNGESFLDNENIWPDIGFIVWDAIEDTQNNRTFEEVEIIEVSFINYLPT